MRFECFSRHIMRHIGDIVGYGVSKDVIRKGVAELQRRVSKGEPVSEAALLLEIPVVMAAKTGLERCSRTSIIQN